MAATQHYLWAAGHFILLISSVRYLLAWLLFRHPGATSYKFSFIGALLSYAIVCHKSLGIPQPNLPWIKKALMDENVQYFILAFFWWTSQPVAIALLPYTIFSVFHALTFTRTTLMPQFLPPGPPSGPNNVPGPHPLAKKVQAWVKANYDTAMKAVAFVELLIMARVFFGALLFRNSLLMPLFYAHFLRQRYYQSLFTRQAVALVKGRIEVFVRKPGANPTVVQVWDKFVMVVEKWGGSTLAPQQPAAARAQ